MLKLHINPVVRSIGIIGAVVALVTGVTFAALNSQAKLTGNTISATAGLQLSVGDGPFASIVEGFDFQDVLPGDTDGVVKSFKLKNATGSAMTLSLHIPAAVTFTDGTVDNSKVHVMLACTTPTPATLSTDSNLTALTADEVAVTGTLAANTTADCTVTATMDSDAITSGASVTSSAFDLRFTGV